MGFLFRCCPSGPFDVGARDVSYSTNKDVLSAHTHLCGRIFYPTGSGRRWLYPPTFWLPSVQYAHGYSSYLFKFAKGARGVQYLKYWLMAAAARVLILVMGFTCMLPVSFGASLLGPGERCKVNNKLEAEPTTGTEHPVLPEPVGLEQWPVIIFSHGLAGTRNTYSNICIELASQGFLVFAIEHADGTASTARLAHNFSDPQLWGVKGRFRFYPGWGGEQTQYERTTFRAGEVLTAHKVLSALHAGEGVPGLSSTCAATFPAMLRGRLDLRHVSVMGHSWGAGTALLAASEHDKFSACIALCPWWGSLPRDCAVLGQGKWLTKTPLMIIGSQAWQTPNAQGKLSCGGVEQEAVLAAATAGLQGVQTFVQPSAAGPSPEVAASVANPAAGTGPGVVLLVPKGTTHSSFDDVLTLFGAVLSPLIALFNFKPGMPARRSLHVTTQASLQFLRTVRGDQSHGLVVEQQATWLAKTFGNDVLFVRTGCASDKSA